MRPLNIIQSAIYTTVSLIILAVFLWYQQATTEQLLWLLTPTTQLTSLFTGLPFMWETPLGYSYPPLKILINKSCAGLNFTLIIWGISVFFFSRYFITWKTKVGAVIGFAAIAYLCTIFANACRITTAIFLLNLSVKLPLLAKPAVHQAEGILFYLSFLVAYFLIMNYYFKTKECE